MSWDKYADISVGTADDIRFLSEAAEGGHAKGPAS